MPYRVSGKCVEVNRDGTWETLKCHPSHDEAVAHHRALEANVEHGKMLATILKYGRVLSRANETEIRSAVQALISVLSRAGIEVTMDEKSIEEKLKMLSPEDAQIFADTFNAMVQDLDAKLGITEALQGEQPQDGEEPPPDEEQPQGDEGNPREGEPPREDASPDEPPPDKKKPPAKKAYWLDQSEVNYTPDEAGDKHCSSCRWFIPQSEFGGSSCTIVATWPAPIVPNGLCNRHEAVPSFEPEPLQVEIVEGRASLDKTTGLSFVQNLKATISHALKSTPKTVPDGNFQVFKHNGRYYWLARHTNNFEDRDKEILSGASHDAYAARVNMGLVDKPELWVWHSKGSRIGQADMVWTHRPKDYSDLCFVFALGHFDDDPISQRAAKGLEKRQGKTELSHGFTFPSWALKNGVYSTYNTFEISVLPERMAANPYTTFEEIQTMALSDKQRRWIQETGGDELLARVERAQAEAEKDGETLKALDKRYKDFADVLKDNGTDTMGVDLKAVLKVVAELIDAQGVVEAERAAEKAARENAETKLAAMQSTIEALNARLDMRPRSAPRAKETEIEGHNALAEALKKVNEGDYEIDSVWGKLKPKA